VIRNDTIRDAILTCNQKLTRVSLIYRTEPTTKKWKKAEKKLKSKRNGCAKKYRQSVRGIRGVSPGEENEGCGGKDLHKGKVLSLE